MNKNTKVSWASMVSSNPLFPLRRLCHRSLQMLDIDQLDNIANSPENQFEKEILISYDELENFKSSERASFSDGTIIKKIYSFCTFKEAISHGCINRLFNEVLGACQICISFSSNSEFQGVFDFLAGESEQLILLTELCIGAALDQKNAGKVCRMLSVGKAQQLQKLCLKFAVDDTGDAMIRSFFDALSKGHCHSLLSLDLTQSYIGEFGAVQLATVMRTGHLPHLQTLNLSINQIEPRGARLLGKALATQACPKLSELFLARNAMTDGAEMLLNEGTSALTCLSMLDIAQNGIDGRSLNQFSRPLSMRKMTCLAVLNLSMNSIGDKVMGRLISSFPNSPALPIRELYFCDIQGAEEFGTSLGNAMARGALPSLEILDGSNNNVTMDGFTGIVKGIDSAGSPLLKILRFSVNRIGSEGIHAFARLVPAGKIREFVEVDFSSNMAPDVKHLVQVISMHHKETPKLRQVILKGNDASVGGMLKNWKIKKKIQVFV